MAQQHMQHSFQFSVAPVSRQLHRALHSHSALQPCCNMKCLYRLARTFKDINEQCRIWGIHSGVSACPDQVLVAHGEPVILCVVVLEAQLADGHGIGVKVAPPQVLEETATLTQQALQTSPGAVVLAVHLQVLCQVMDLAC